MNNTFSSEQISRTCILDANLISRQYKINVMAKFMESKSRKSKLKQDQIAKQLGCSSGTLQQHKQDINMLSPNRIPPKSQERR